MGMCHLLLEDVPFQPCSQQQPGLMWLWGAGLDGLVSEHQWKAGWPALVLSGGAVPSYVHVAT